MTNKIGNKIYKPLSQKSKAELNKQIKEYKEHIKELQLQINYDRYAIKRVREIRDSK